MWSVCVEKSGYVWVYVWLLYDAKDVRRGFLAGLSNGH